jgi:hypothetical protein
MATTIQIEDAEWKRLNARKNPGETFADVAERVCDKADAYDEMAEPENERGAVVPDAEDPSEPDDDVHARARERIESMALPGDDDVLDARREAVYSLWEFLRAEGVASKREFLERVDPDAVSYASAESFWSNCIKGRDALQSMPGVEPPKEGMHRWVYHP